MQKLKEKQEKEFDENWIIFERPDYCVKAFICIEGESNSCNRLKEIETGRVLDKVRQETIEYERKRIKKIMNKELLSWNSGGEYYDNVSKAIQNILNKLK